MAFARSAALKYNARTGSDKKLPAGLFLILLIYFGFLPFADVAAGFFATQFDINWFAVAYKMGAIALLALFVVAGRFSILYALNALILIVLLIVGAGLRQTWGQGGMLDDLLFIARGPILLSCVLLMLMEASKAELDRVAKVYFSLTWLVTSGSILITSLLGVSLASYGAGYGVKGFYQAANEVTFTFVLAWWFIQVRMVKSPIFALFFLSATCFIIYSIGTKSGFVMIPILLIWYACRLLSITRFWAITAFIIGMIIVSSVAGSIFLAVLPYLPAAESAEFFIDTYGVETTLTGGRFLDMDAIIRTIRTFTLWELIFGMGFNNFWFTIDGFSVESDLIDTLGGGGILFAGWFYGILLSGYLKSATWSARGRKMDGPWAYLFIAVILYSIFVGHVAFAATPLVTVGMFLALAQKEKIGARPGRSLLVQ